MVKFFFMGCWNKDGAPRNIVLNALRQDVKRHGLQVGIVAGDNVYPHKDATTDTKVYHPQTVDVGFAKLGMVPIPTKMILGNHNVKYKEILEHENHIASAQNINLYQNNEIWTVGNVTFAFVNTNEPETIPAFIAKHAHAFRSSTWTLVVGHHPLVSLKGKGNKAKVSVLSNVRAIINALQDLDNVMYLCADVHNFQLGKVTLNGIEVPMVVSGTGGADPDDVVPDIDEVHVKGEVEGSYKLVHQNMPYGYCIIDTSDSAISVRYKRLTTEYGIVENYAEFHKGNRDFSNSERYIKVNGRKRKVKNI